MATTTESLVMTGHVAQTTPYAWPWNGELDARGTAVLVVDAPDASLSDGCLRNVEVVVATLRRAGAAVIRVQTARPPRLHPRPSVPGGTAAGTGAIPADRAVSSRGVDGFFGGPLESLLREAGIVRLILVGAWLETSVHSTMRTANDMGFECLLVVDACAPGDESLVANSVSMIEMSGGIFGAVGVTTCVAEAYADQEERPA